MWRKVLIFLSLFACSGEAKPAASGASPPFTPPPPDPQAELHWQIELATHYPCSLGVGEHRRAVEWVIQHADETHARIVAMVESGAMLNMSSTARILGRIGRPESVGTLDRVLQRGEELTSWDAANGLAMHPDPAA